MTTIQIILFTGLITIGINLFAICNKKKPEQTKSSNTVTFNDQLKIFQQLNFNLNPGTSISDIDRWPNGLKEFEESPFSLLYITLGQEIEREPFTPLTNKCWDFDTEAIEDNGDYARIVKNLERITRGELKFSNVTDYVNIELNKAWVSFTLNGEKYKWDLKVNDDWVDPELFSKIVELTTKYNTKGKFTYFDTGGQDMLIGYETPESLIKIKKITGLEIYWLN